MGLPSKPRNLTVIVQPSSDSLNISFPITVPTIHTPNPIILNLVIQPIANAGKVEVTVSADTSGDVQAQVQVEAYIKGRVEENALGDRLTSLKCDVPQWLDTICTELYG